MDYNPLPDLLIMGAFILTLVGFIKVTSTKPKPYKNYHMIDQAKRWGK